LKAGIAVTNDISTQLRPILQTALSGNRSWLPDHVYAGVVQEILGNGSIAVLINNKVYQALTHIPVHSGQLLNLRLLGTLPEPHFAITGFADAVRQPNSPPSSLPISAAAVQHAAPPTVAMFSKLNPGIEGLAKALLQYPQQLARIAPQLQSLLTAIANTPLPAGDLAKPGKLKAYVQNSGFFYDSHMAAGIDGNDADLKGLLLQLLGALQHKRTLVLQNGRPGFIEHQPAPRPASLATSLKEYAAQHDNALARDLKNIITQNAETTLLQIVMSQLAARDKSTETDRAFVMHLMIAHEEKYVPLELELRQQRYDGEEFWEASFKIDLPISGTMQWTIAVKNTSVNIQLSSNNPTTRLNMGSQTGLLGELMERQNLRLGHFSCMEMESL
jgi:hypothetical protein